jgi:hypothetical protein
VILPNSALLKNLKLAREDHNMALFSYNGRKPQNILIGTP